jgi:hypothetical protein
MQGPVQNAEYDLEIVPGTCPVIRASENSNSPRMVLSDDEESTMIAEFLRTCERSLSGLRDSWIRECHKFHTIGLLLPIRESHDGKISGRGKKGRAEMRLRDSKFPKKWVILLRSARLSRYCPRMMYNARSVMYGEEYSPKETQLPTRYSSYFIQEEDKGNISSSVCMRCCLHSRNSFSSSRLANGIIFPQFLSHAPFSYLFSFLYSPNA